MTEPGPRQLGLFGGGEELPVDAAHVPEDLAAAAARVPPRIRLGTSSWSFPGWRGLVYDRSASTAQLAKHGLAAYARHPALRTVGIDRTFYAPIAAADFAAYASAVPDDFRFLVKACSANTARQVRADDGSWCDNPAFLDAGFARDEVVAPFAEGLGPKAGPLVFQFPPQGPGVRAGAFARELGAFLGALPEGPRYAVELRDAHLLTASYVDALRDAGASHCLSLHPRMQRLAEQAELASRAGRTLVVRWMLRRGLAYEAARQRYAPFSALVDEDRDLRGALAERCLEAARRETDVFVIVNNKAEGCAPQSAFELTRAMAAAR